ARKLFAQFFVYFRYGDYRGISNTFVTIVRIVETARNFGEQRLPVFSCDDIEDRQGKVAYLVREQALKDLPLLVVPYHRVLEYYNKVPVLPAHRIKQHHIAMHLFQLALFHGKVEEGLYIARRNPG